MSKPQPHLSRTRALPPIATAPDASLALDLARAAISGPGLLFVDASGSRLARLAAIATAFVPAIEALVLPGWDNLPYDRTPPSPSIMGERAYALACLAAPATHPRLVLTSARALLQLVPAAGHWADALLRLAPGDELDEAAFRTRLASFGYHFDEHVDRPGEVAMRGHVIDIFPGARELPVRIEVAEGRITALHAFDPASQRSRLDLDHLILRPVVEAEPAPEQVAAEAERLAHPDIAAPEESDAAPLDPSSLQSSLLDYVGDMPILLHWSAAQHWRDAEEHVAEAHATACVAARTAASGLVPPKPAQLYLAAADLESRLERAGAKTLAESPEEGVPPARDLAGLLTQITDAGEHRVLIATAAAAKPVLAALKRRGITGARLARDWADALEGEGRVACLALELAEGFSRDGMRVLPAPVSLTRAAVHGPNLLVEEPPRLSDIVVHEDHGICRLAGLRQVGEEERLALAFHEDTELLVPMDDLARIWRYGSEAGQVTLDRLHGEAWHRRRAEIGTEITKTAKTLAEAAATRAATPAPVITPPAAAFARVADRFAFAPSPDQQAAIDAVLADLGAGRPMDRLVCGDVGFGKTEVALRAAAATALSGHQVAIVAPTTVLARQHLESFRKRLAGTGLRVEPLMRGADVEAVRAGLADGAIQVVVGTQAVAGDKIAFHRLGLVVIDEEQRFGDADKRKLAGLRTRAGAVHVLVMTATPIPRTLQSAMVGLRDISVIATPPVARQPTRTFVLPLGEALVREALLRERARGGQSFVVAPRIEDLAPLAVKLAEWVPELSLATAHGRLKPEALTDLVTKFAAGGHDVLLATNIIEAGLDIPRANTILITGPHRFGLAQLHQMRGRVGRGARRGTAYVLTDPGARLAPSTARRLHTLETLEGLGAGVGVAMADMDRRGAGDLFGDAQAGHVNAIGTELYQHLLARELAHAAPHTPAALRTEVTGRIPADHVPEANLRLDLYRRLARLSDAHGIDDFAAEVTDRFGDIPGPLANLITLARLRVWCETHGILAVDAGPLAVALSLADEEQAARLGAELHDARVKQSRVLLPIAVPEAEARLSELIGRLLA